MQRLWIRSPMPHCDISLTYHKTTDQLKCHYCGYQENPPSRCPNCESDHIRQVGTGTQRVEELLQQEFLKLVL